MVMDCVALGPEIQCSNIGSGAEGIKGEENRVYSQTLIYDHHWTRISVVNRGPMWPGSIIWLFFAEVVKQMRSLSKPRGCRCKATLSNGSFLPENCKKCHEEQSYDAATGHTCEPVAKGQKYNRESCGSHNLGDGSWVIWVHCNCKWSLSNRL